MQVLALCIAVACSPPAGHTCSHLRSPGLLFLTALAGFSALQTLHSCRTGRLPPLPVISQTSSLAASHSLYAGTRPLRSRLSHHLPPTMPLPTSLPDSFVTAQQQQQKVCCALWHSASSSSKSPFFGGGAVTTLSLSLSDTQSLTGVSL